MPKRRRPGRGGRRGGTKNTGNEEGNGDQWTNRNDALEMANGRFERYYRAQKIIPDEEWEDFMSALRRPLPSTFRVAGHRQMADSLNDAIKNTYVPELQKATFENEPLPVPTSIPWYPGGLAWQLNVARKSLRKSAEYKRFHNFLVYETDVGNISRQEAVSMLPPLFLDVEPHHYVIDLCAAPGSKTSQLLEALHAPTSSTTNSSEIDGTQPTGLLIANDSDHKRAHLLVHTSARLPSPSIMVTNLDASIFPILRMSQTSESGESIQGSAPGKKTSRILRFDRILADVPCSGDGTIRKNLNIWKTWSPMDGNGLHSLQIRILQRAMRMLKDDKYRKSTVETGGDFNVKVDKSRIVYSTCSLNPVENEAVIAAALNSIPDFELVDVSERLPSLIRRSGLTTWQPCVDRDVDLRFSTYDEYVNHLAESNKNTNSKSSSKDSVRNRMLPTHWPPANAEELSLTRCLRIYPHLQDSGGFFVAVLQRKPITQGEKSATSQKRANESLNDNRSKRHKTLEEEDVPMEEGTDSKLVDDVHFEQVLDMSNETVQQNDANGDESKKTENSVIENDGQPVETGGAFKEHPFTFLASDDRNLRACISRLKLSTEFPSSNLYVRNPAGAPIRSLYLVNDAVKAVMDQTSYSRLRLISAGTKVIGRSELSTGVKAALSALVDSESNGEVDLDSPSNQALRDAAQFRVLSEGILAILPYLNRTTFVEGDASSLRTLLEGYYPLLSSFSGAFHDALREKELGNQIVRFPPGTYGSTVFTHELILPLWRSEASVSLMIDKKAKSALSLRLFGEDVTPTGQKAANKQGPESTVVATVEMEGGDGGDE